MIRSGSTNVSGIVAQGSVLDSALVIVISRPILSSRQCPRRTSEATGGVAFAGLTVGGGTVSAGLTADGVASAGFTGGGVAVPCAGSSRIWSRPPSIWITASSGG